MSDPATGGHPPGTETCGCCSGVLARTPQPVDNRPGLPEVRYRSGTYGDFRASLLAGLTSSSRPALARLRTRAPDDPTIALLDAWAMACDVLTFYNERLLNESFLRTAADRTTLQELGKLVAYRLDPGVAAETHVAFTLERPPVVPAALPPDPGLLPATTPAAVTLPVGLRLQSIPGPGEQPQTFETVEQIDARPEWNALPAARTKSYPPVLDRQDAWLDGVGLNLRRGDAVLFASKDLANDRWDLRLIDAVQDDPDGDRTHIRWDEGLGSLNPANNPADAPDIFVLRKRCAVFGHQAPVWRALNDNFRDGYRIVHGGTATQNEWQNFVSTTTPTDSGAESVVTVDLDGSHPDVAVGSWVVVSQESGTFYRELYEVTARNELSREEFAVSGRVTRLTLKGEAHAFGSPREVSVFAVADPLTLVEAPDDSAVSGATVVVDGDARAMAVGRTVMLAGRSAAGVPQAEHLVVQSVAALPGNRTLMTFAAAAGAAYERASAVVFGNVAKVTHGETVQQVLGDGDATRAFQSMPLRQGPLTHVQAETPEGSASTLTVRVDDVAWQERPSLYGAGPHDRVFVTRTEADGTVVAAFGDGVTGARLPSGSHNVRATYRKGTGAGGNVAAGAIAQPLDRPLGLKAATNPAAATGGVDAEDGAAARRSMPLPVRTLGRAVSLRDYADFALAYAGIGLADASVLTLRAGRAVVVTVTGPGGVAAPATTVQHLGAALREHGDPHVRVVVMAHRPAAFRLALKVAVRADHDPTVVLPAVEAALRAAFGLAARDLAQPVERSSVIAVAAAVPGVAGIDLDRLYRGSTPTLETRLVAARAAVDATGNPVAAELLALADGPFDWLQEVP